MDPLDTVINSMGRGHRRGDALMAARLERCGQRLGRVASDLEPELPTLAAARDERAPGERRGSTWNAGGLVGWMIMDVDGVESNVFERLMRNETRKRNTAS